MLRRSQFIDRTIMMAAMEPSLDKLLPAPTSLSARPQRASIEAASIMSF